MKTQINKHLFNKPKICIDHKYSYFQKWSMFRLLYRNLFQYNYLYFFFVCLLAKVCNLPVYKIIPNIPEYIFNNCIHSYKLLYFFFFFFVNYLQTFFGFFFSFLLLGEGIFYFLTKKQLQVKILFSTLVVESKRLTLSNNISEYLYNTFFD